MTQLGRMTRYGLAHLVRFLRDHERLPTADEIEEGWTEEHPSGVRIDGFADLVPALAGRGAETDAEDGIRIHEALPLPRRVAADGLVWPWLAVCVGADYTARRWQSEGKTLSLPRIDSDFRRNTFARLWWGVENTRVDNVRDVADALDLSGADDRYWFTRQTLGQHGLQVALAGRDLFQSRTATVAFLALVSRRSPTTEDIEQLIKWYNLGLSTVVVEFFEPADDVGRYEVDPERCVALFRYLDGLTEPYWRSKAEAAAPAIEAVGDRRPGFVERAIRFFRRR